MLKIFHIAFVIANHSQQFHLIYLGITLMLQIFHGVFVIAHLSKQSHLTCLNILLMLQVFIDVLVIAETLHYHHQYLTFRHYKQNSLIWNIVSMYLPQHTATQEQFSQFGTTSRLQLDTVASQTAQP